MNNLFIVSQFGHRRNNIGAAYRQRKKTVAVMDWTDFGAAD